jgi:hypothetical protein
VPDGDRIKCLDCGSIWKEFSGQGIIRPEVKDEKRAATIRELRELARRKESVANPEPVFLHSADPEPAQHIPELQPKTKTMAAPFVLAAILLVSGVAATLWFMGLSNPNIPSDKIALHGIQLKEKIGRNGAKIITVHGTVINGTAESKSVPPIAIILRQTDGGEIFRWRHSSAMPVLQPGTKSRFASSIQYDTPSVAYAEAVFE